jgi:hypothetical protein
MESGVFFLSKAYLLIIESGDLALWLLLRVFCRGFFLVARFIPLDSPARGLFIAI